MLRLDDLPRLLDEIRAIASGPAAGLMDRARVRGARGAGACASRRRERPRPLRAARRRASWRGGRCSHGCRGRVIVTGMGKSGLIGRKIAATLASDRDAAPSSSTPRRESTATWGWWRARTSCVALSNFGETDEVLALLPALKRLGIPLVLLTGAPASTLARQADIVIDVGVAEEACPMNLAPTSSTTAALAMGDALAMALLDLRGLRPEDYAALHPRGSLGWKSLFKVGDLMHTGDAIPVVSEQATMKEAIEEMTGRGSGSPPWWTTGAAWSGSSPTATCAASSSPTGPACSSGARGNV